MFDVYICVFHLSRLFHLLFPLPIVYHILITHLVSYSSFCNSHSEQTLGLGPAPGKKPKVKFAGQDSDSDEENDEEFDSDDEFPDYLMDEMDPEAMAQYRAAQQNNKR